MVWNSGGINAKCYWHLALGWKEFNCTTCSWSSSFSDINGINSAMIWCISYMPTLSYMLESATQKSFSYTVNSYLRVDLIILRNLEITWLEKQIPRWLTTPLWKYQKHEFSHIEGSSVPGKPMESYNMTACPVHFREGVD